MPKDATTVLALDPKAPRTIHVLHVAKKLGGAVVIRGDEQEPVTVKLAPVGAITGKVLDSDGQPIAGVSVGVQFNVATASELYRQVNLSQTPPKTDKNGLFRLDGIVPGMKFYLSMMKGQEYYTGEPKIGQKQVKSGETLDLGAIKVQGQKIGQ